MSQSPSRRNLPPSWPSQRDPAGDDDGAFELEPQADASPSTTASAATRNERLPARPLNDAIVSLPRSFTSAFPADRPAVNRTRHSIRYRARQTPVRGFQPIAPTPGVASGSPKPPTPRVHCSSPIRLRPRRGLSMQHREDNGRRNLRTPSFGHRDCASSHLNRSGFGWALRPAKMHAACLAIAPITLRAIEPSSATNRGGSHLPNRETISLV